MYFKNAIQSYGKLQPAVLFTVMYYLDRLGIPDHEIQAYLPLVEAYVNQHPELLASVSVDQINSGSATNGQVLTANGSGTASFQDAGGGGAAQSPLQGRDTPIANNAETPVFSFPLGAGEAVFFTLTGIILAKKAADWAVFNFIEAFGVYNNSGSLVQVGQDRVDFQNANSGGAINLISAQNNAGNGTLFTLTLSTGVVSVTVNPGDIGATPDSMVLTHAFDNPASKTITFL